MHKNTGNKHITPIMEVTINEISNNNVCATTTGSDQPVHTCSLIRALTSPFLFYDCSTTDQKSFEVSKLNRNLHKSMSKCHFVQNHMFQLKMLIDNNKNYILCPAFNVNDVFYMCFVLGLITSNHVIVLFHTYIMLKP